MAMMALGVFVFSLSTLPFQTLKQQLGWRHPSTSRVGARPAHQFLGSEDETITLSGVLLPELTGGRLSLDLVRAMGDGGRAWPLIDGTGRIHGLYVITSLEQTQTLFFDDGAPRRIEFQLTLKRVGNDSLHRLGALVSGLRSLI